jgi:hypothetical protein
VGLKRQRSVEGMGCGAFLGDSMGNKWWINGKQMELSCHMGIIPKSSSRHGWPYWHLVGDLGNAYDLRSPPDHGSNFSRSLRSGNIIEICWDILCEFCGTGDMRWYIVNVDLVGCNGDVQG